MGKGIDAARAAGTGLHADVLDDFKDQLIIVLMKRLAVKGKLAIPLAEMDDTGQDFLSFSVNDGIFNFILGRKS